MKLNANEQKLIENNISLIEDNEVITISIKAKYFIGSDEATISEKSLDRYLKVMKKVIGFHDSESLVNGVKVKEFSVLSTIKIDNYVSDIAKITSVITDEQINSLTYLLEKIMSDKGTDTDLLA